MLAAALSTRALSQATRTPAVSYAVRALSAKSSEQEKLIAQLIKDNPMLVQATVKTAEALNLTGASNPSANEIAKLAEQYVNVKAAVSYTESAVGQVLRNGNTSALIKEPVVVSITGAAGAIGYSLAFRVAGGMMLGPHQPVILKLIEIEPAMQALQGVVMELKDCAFPLVAGIEIHTDLEKGFANADYALLVGSKPRSKGMERGDLLKENGKIFVGQGKAINTTAKKSIKVVVVGNPANTNCLIAANNAPNIPAENFSALTRLDHDRALAQVADKINCHTSEIEKLCIWGNHSATQYPDLSYATVKGTSVKKIINDDKWINDTFIPTVQQRGAAIIEARGASSAASAANAALHHIRDWVQGTAGGWTSMAVPSCNEYGIGAGVYYSYPVICEDGKFTKVLGLRVDKFSQEKMDLTKKELFSERDMVKGLLPN